MENSELFDNSGCRQGDFNYYQIGQIIKSNTYKYITTNICISTTSNKPNNLHISYMLNVTAI